MKKVVSILLTLALFLAGCQAADNSSLPTPPVDEATVPDATVSETESFEVTDDPIVYEQEVMYAISLPLVAEYSYTANSEMNFSHTYQNIHIVHQDPEVANSIILDFLNKMDAAHIRAAEVSEAAESEFMGTAFYYDVHYSPTRIDQIALSLYGTTSSYSGGNHPMHYSHAVNYNMLTGELLTLGSILKHIDSKAQLVDLVIQKADLIAAEKQLYGDYADCIADRFSVEESFDQDWYFTSTGLCFFFQTYEIAPYSSGIITVEVPYSELTGIIADDFFPPEADVFVGAVQCQLANSVDISGYTQMAELVLDPSGEQVLLYADGAVRDVRIESGYWNSDATEFTPICTVFAANSLTPQDGIVVHTYIPDVLPNLRVSYLNGSETVSLYLFQSGKDGSVFLSE